MKNLYGETEAVRYGKSEYARLINEFGGILISEVLSKHVKPSQTLLELACGDGVFSKDLHAAFPGLRIISTDYSPQFIDVCRKEVGEDDHLSFEVLNALELRSFHPGERIDVIVFRNSEVYFDKAEKQALIQAIYERLHPGGYLLYEPVQWAEDILNALPGKNSGIRDMYSHDYAISSMKALYMTEENFLKAHRDTGFELCDQHSRDVVVEVSDYKTFKQELSCGISQRMKLAGYNIKRLMLMCRLLGIHYRSEKKQSAYLFQKPL